MQPPQFRVTTFLTLPLVSE